MLLVVLLLAIKVFFWQDAYANPVNNIWNVRSIDTMKTSRDLARVKLYDISYDEKIDEQVKFVKDLGANYIAIDTPYDNEFIPYLKRWVNAARKYNLKIWYRGSFSGYEGWFDYPKNVSPNELLSKTALFIESNNYLFKDGDIFDPCPECENAGYWPQPTKNADYNEFVIKKNLVLKNSFEKINKKVIYNYNSIIGGRAKEILNQNTLNNLNNIVAIDHYASNDKSYKDYIEYFRKHNTNVVFSEFGAPIPDINGQMTDEEQADFVKNVLNILYSEKNNVSGVNYWVLYNGTTSLLNFDFSSKPVASVLKNYYSPAVINGQIKNPLGDNIEKISIETKDKLNKTKTDKFGKYQIVVPAGTTNLIIGGNNYNSVHISANLKNNETINKNIVLTPIKTNFIYDIRLKINNFFKLKK